MKILLIEDDEYISDFLVSGFRQEGCVITHVIDGVDGLYEAVNQSYDVIILDIMIPKKDGLEVLADFRGEGHATPVIILSAKHSVAEKVKGLQSGADDYLVKPFAFPELLARCQSLYRRGRNSLSQSHEIIYGELSLNILKRELKRDGNVINLNQREFSLIKLMLENPEKVITKTAILEYVWGHQFDPQTNVVDVLVCRLRSKVDKGFTIPSIHTLRGVGYVLKF